MSVLTSRTPISTKRRQLRKGTFSCWECKRRKQRCEFTSEFSSICVSCQRRGASCIGQDLLETSKTPDSELGERIDAVEKLVRRLVRQRSRRADGADEEVSHDGVRNELSTSSTNERLDLMDDRLSFQSLLSTTHKLYPGFRSLSSQLYAVLPTPTETTLILTDGKFFNLPIHVRGRPSKETTAPDINGIQLARICEPPLPTAHPVHLAQKLIQLALCLHQLVKPMFDAAKRYFEIASRHVTSQDWLMESIDGIEILMLESCYHINVGNTRRAWHTVRRALSTAQLMGLDAQANQVDCREENVWFRLMLADRTLSWMLGLPMAVADNTFATKNELVHDAWSSKLERAHTIVFGDVITRNMRMQRRDRLTTRSADHHSPHLYDDCEVTQNIDHEMKQAAQFVPASWWLCPKDADTMERTERLFTQMHHFFVIIIIHQPYVLRDSRPDSTFGSPFDYAYSSRAVVNASREILLRFVILRRSHSTLSYRGLDDKAFITTRLFLVIHLQGHNLGPANVLEHQRPQDLAVINELITVLDTTSRANQDALGMAMVVTLKKLLEIEERSARGHSYRVWMEDEAVQHDNVEDAMRIPVPYFGCMCITEQASAHQPGLFLEFEPSCEEDLGFMDVAGTSHQSLCLNAEDDANFMHSWLTEGPTVEQSGDFMCLTS